MLFYNYISKGYAKDKPLQQAKLDYIATAEGRTITSQYWVSLVLIGDMTPIDMNTSSRLSWYRFADIIIFITIILFFKHSKANLDKALKKISVSNQLILFLPSFSIHKK